MESWKETRLPMSDELDLFEKRLKKMQPRRVSDSLRAGISRELGESSQVQGNALPFAGRRSGPLWLYAGLAASLFLALGYWHVVTDRDGNMNVPGTAVVLTKPRHADVHPVADRSISVDTVLLRTRDEGIALGEDSKPVRKVRYRLLDTVQWDEPEDRNEYRVVSTRDAIAYVPVRVD